MRKSEKLIANQSRADFGKNQKSSGAPAASAVSTLAGLCLLVVIVAVLIGLLVSVLRSAGVTDIAPSAWEYLAFSAVVVSLRAIDSAVFGASRRAR